MREWNEWMDMLKEKGIWKDAFPLGAGTVVTATATTAYHHEYLDISGFLVIEVGSMDEAIHIAKEAPNLKQGGRVQIREVRPNSNI